MEKTKKRMRPKMLPNWASTETNANRIGSRDKTNECHKTAVQIQNHHENTKSITSCCRISCI